MSALFLYLAASALATFILGIIVYANNPKVLSGRVYFLLCLTGALWVLTNAALELDQLLGWERLLLQLITPLSLSSAYLTALFAANFPIGTPIVNRLLRYISPLVFVVVALSFTSLNINYVSASEYELGALYPYYLSLMVLLVFVAIATLYHNYVNSVQLVKLQLAYIFFGVSLTALPAVLFGAVLPAANEENYSALAPGFVIFFFVFSGLAIMRHRLFDVRIVVSRVLAYFLSVMTLGGLYAIIAFSFFDRLLFQGQDFELNQQLTFTALAVFLSFTFQPIKRYFDKLSNRLFYRDAYDPQDFLDELNKVLVTKVDLEPMLGDIVATINTHLKSSFCTFSVRQTQYLENRLVGDDHQFQEKDLLEMGHLASHVHSAVIVADELDEAHTELKELMQKNDVAVIARLVTTIEYDVEGVGYMMLGLKRSGSPYGTQDIKIIEIIANELVIAIQNALRFEEIEQFNITLQEKVEDATKRLKRTNEKLRQMDETKDEFISMASHQLRTPLTSVKGYLSMVLEGDAGDIKPMQEKLLSQAFISSQRMVYLIADLLNVSRLRTGKFVIEATEANLAELVQGEVDQLLETAESRQLSLSYDKPADFPMLMLDETKIRQVVMNFIDNAIYYTPAGGSIEVKVVDKPESVECVITDDGMGVPKDDQQHLFTKFYRAGNARKARPDGTGLGLFMAKKVIVAQGGAVIFKSKEGHGSTFGFTFPKAKLLPKYVAETESSGS
jgi:signal transduction histidine kinase